jgi:hypothetical protein
MQLREGESLQTRMMRFRTPGCYPLTKSVNCFPAKVTCKDGLAKGSFHVA